MSELETLMKPLQGGRGFASLKLVDNYLNKGDLPRIHNAIGKALEQLPAELYNHGALDLGACHGMLTVRLASLFNRVVAIEPDQRSVDVYVNHVLPRIKWDAEMHCMKMDLLDTEKYQAFVRLLRMNDVRTLVARRSLPETLAETYGSGNATTFEKACEAGRAMTRALIEAGVTCIVLEGRKTNYKTHASPLWSADLEVSALGAPWQVSRSVGDVRVLVR